MMNIVHWTQVTLAELMLAREFEVNGDQEFVIIYW